jgi:putative ABC transport system ATP-binding protein
MIEVQNLTKTYDRQDGAVHALDDANLSVERGEFVVIRGPSGSGKSTLLLTIGGLIRPTRGKVIVEEKDLYALSSRDRARFRAERIGFVFQMFHLLPYLDVIENVLVPTIPRAEKPDRGKAMELLEWLKMSSRVHHRPSQLSTGERQRVAIARALLNRPNLVLADEPTGNLDPDNAAQVLGYLGSFHEEGGTVLLVTHEKSAEEYSERVVLLENGRIRSAGR